MTRARPTATPATNERLTWATWALAGVAAAAAGIAASELAAGLLPGFPSLVIAVGTQVIALQPPGAKDFMVGLFGTNDKLALNIFIVVVALVVAAGVGLLARRHGGAATLVIVGFGVVGFAAAAAESDVTISVALAEGPPRRRRRLRRAQRADHAGPPGRAAGGTRSHARAPGRHRTLPGGHADAS